MKTVQGNMIAKGKRFALIASRFNDFLTKELVAGCVDTLLRHGADEKDITLAWVPGAFELPLAAQKLAESKAIDAVVCLGTVIRGATPHFEYVAQEAAKGIARVAQETGKPVSLGVITADTIEQAIERAGTKDGNKGRDAALSAIEMVNLMGQLS